MGLSRGGAWFGKRRQLWERNATPQNALLSLTFISYLLFFSPCNLFTECLCQRMFDHKTFVYMLHVCDVKCVYTLHYKHMCLWCECLSIQHRLRSHKAAQLHIPLKNLAIKHWGDFNPRNRTLAHTNECTRTYTHFYTTRTHSHTYAQTELYSHVAHTLMLSLAHSHTHAQGRGLCIIAGTLPAYMSLIRLRSRERARIKPSLIRNRVYRFHTIGVTMRLA